MPSVFSAYGLRSFVCSALTVMKSDGRRIVCGEIGPFPSNLPELLSYDNKFQTIMSLDQTVCEDLKAFERRLTEVIASLQPSTLRWRMLLGVISMCTTVGAWHWITDPNTSAVSFAQSLCNHPFFTIASIVLVILFMMGVHRRVIAPSIITQRTRSVLGDFNMSCDDTGKLILKPTRPPHPHES